MELHGIPILVGGDWNMTFIFQHIGNNHLNWLIFFRGVQTTNQYLFWCYLNMVLESIFPLSYPHGLFTHFWIPLANPGEDCASTFEPLVRPLDGMAPLVHRNDGWGIIPFGPALPSGFKHGWKIPALNGGFELGTSAISSYFYGPFSITSRVWLPEGIFSRRQWHVSARSTLEAEQFCPPGSERGNWKFPTWKWRRFIMTQSCSMVLVYWPTKLDDF